MSSKRSPLSRLRVFAPVLALGLTATASYGQTQSLAAPRVLAEVSPSQMVTLQGGKQPLAQARFDRGRVPDSTPTGHMMVVLKRSDAQEQALQQMLAAQLDPKSPSYHKWMTPESFGAQFGIADADVQAVSAYLSSQGFAVGRVFKNKMAIEFSGTTGQVRSSFQTEIHSYLVNGQTFHANATAPKIPAALVPVVRGFAAMNNYKTPVKHAQQMLLNRKTGQAHPLYSDEVNSVESVSPGDLATIYNIPANYTGSGVTVGIIADSNINDAIPANYRRTFGLQVNPPTVVIDGNDPGINADADLAYAQIELVAATAPAARVTLYTSATTQLDTGVDFASIRALEDNAVQVLVFGFEACEATLGSGNQLFSLIWEQAAAQGISVIAGTGSGGSAECDAAVGGGQPVAAASQGLAVNGYASTAFNTAVGASDFYYGPTGSITVGDLSGFLQYWNLDNGGTAGYTSAKGYIPEQPNNSSYQATNQETFNPYVVATGGGVSTAGVINDDGSVSPHPKPSYQSGSGNSVSTTARIVPDVSFFGGNYNNASAYILCIDASDCVNGSPDALQYSGGGGTGAAAAAFAGIAALVVQAKGVQGNLNPALYATHAAAPSAFHDIVAGTNTVQCVGGSPNCAGGLMSSGGSLAYQAVAGYDAASGLGSVNVANLISNWTTPKGGATVTVTLTTPGTTTPVGGFHHGDAVQLNVSVTGASGIPTGDVAITTSSPQASGPGVEVMTLVNGIAVDNSVGTVLPGGSYRLTARYAGDGTYAPAVASIPVNVYQIASGLVLITEDGQNRPLPSYTGQTLPYGSSVQFSFQVYSTTDVNDAGTPSGTITVYDNGGRLTAVPINSEGYASFVSTRLSAGAHNFTATYGGDNTYGSTSLNGPHPLLTIGGAPTATTLLSTASSLASRNATFQLLATVTPTGGNAGAAPGGSVRFNTTTGSLLGSANLNLGGNSGTNRASSAVLMVNRQALPAGSTSVIATYVPDGTGNYTGSASSALSIAVGGGAGFINTTVKLAATPANAVNFLDSSTLDFTATVTPASGAAVANESVNFFSNGTLLGTGTTDATGVASFTIPPSDDTGFLPLPLGQSSISAQYVGDATHASSATAYTVNVYGEGSTPDFSMQGESVYQTITSSSNTANFAVQFTSMNGFSANGTTIALTYRKPVAFNCTGSPTGPNFAGGTYASVTVSCGPAPGYVVAMLDKPNPHLLWMAEGGTALAFLFLFGMPARRRSWQSMIGTLALIVVAFGVSGCGATVAKGQYQDYYNSINNQATPQAAGVITPGTYLINVTGTARVFVKSQPNTTVTVVHNLPLKIVVQ